MSEFIQKKKYAHISTQWNKHLHIFQYAGLCFILIWGALWMFPFMSFSSEYNYFNSQSCGAHFSLPPHPYFNVNAYNSL